MGQAKNRRAEIAELKAVPKDTTGLHNHRLYHGTTETVARLIIDQGRTLQPRGTERESLYPTMPSRCDCVYLTDFYGVKYALDAVVGELKQRGIEEWTLAGALVEMDMSKLSPSNMVPDEDFLAKLHMVWRLLSPKRRPQLSLCRAQTAIATASDGTDLKLGRQHGRVALIPQGGANYIQQFHVISWLLDEGGSVSLKSGPFAALRVPGRQHDYRDDRELVILLHH